MMQFPDLEIPEGLAGTVYVATGIVAAAIILSKLSKRSGLEAIPTFGSSGWIGSWSAAYRFNANATQVIQDGYEKYKSKAFKVTDASRWIVVVSNREQMEELRKAPEDALSFVDAAEELTNMKYLMGPELHGNPYHIDVIRSQLTRSIRRSYAEIRDEIVVAFDDILDLEGNEWRGVPAYLTIQKVVCRTSNRLFVGLPLCRDPDWISINLRCTLDIVEGARTINRFPKFLAPFIAYIMTDVPGTTARAMNHLRPIIEERMKKLEEYCHGWDDQPNDLLMWLLGAAEGPEHSMRLLTSRVLLINFVAINTSSNAFCHVLFYLAAHPQYVQPLREEVESIIEKEGWSKASIGKMRKIDSFIKETQRMEMGPLSLMRIARKDFTFSDGTFIPKGTFVMSPARSIHLDEEVYDNADVFDPFRFSNMRDEDGEGTKHQFISTSLDFLLFGHGKHACPGRFFASSELKTMLAHIVVTYDIKLEDHAHFPHTIRVGHGHLANPFACVMFRKRSN